jgi:hypothetical protein
MWLKDALQFATETSIVIIDALAFVIARSVRGLLLRLAEGSDLAALYRGL